MKKLTLIAAAFALLAVSCKKSGSPSNSSYYIKATMDGTAKTFNTNCFATIDSLSGSVTLTMVGSVKAPPDLESIDLTINNTPSGKAIVAGSYNEISTTDYLIVGVYNPDSTTVVFGTGINPAPANPFQLTITSINKTSVQGTFSGDFYYVNTTTGAFGPAKKTFTNGQFNLKIMPI